MKSKNKDFFPLTLVAKAKEKNKNIEVTLTFDPAKPMVLQGDNGLSKKSSVVGNASYYYSFSRLNTQGSISINGNSVSVIGDAWMDREWSTSALDENQSGWDWFSLQLSNNEEIMYYQLRNENGHIEPTSSGSLIGSSGVVTKLSGKQVNIKVLGFWKSRSGVTYPSGWEFTIPEKETKLHITPLIEDQEINFTVRYWEGAVKIEGLLNGKDVFGSGYVELSGYGVEAE